MRHGRVSSSTAIQSDSSKSSYEIYTFDLIIAQDLLATKITNAENFYQKVFENENPAQTFTIKHVILCDKIFCEKPYTIYSKLKSRPQNTSFQIIITPYEDLHIEIKKNSQFYTNYIKWIMMQRFLSNYEEIMKNIRKRERMKKKMILLQSILSTRKVLSLNILS